MAGSERIDGRGDDDFVLPGRLRRLREELDEEAVPALAGAPDEVAALVELGYAIRPPTHEGLARPYGAILVADPIDEARLDLGPLDHEVLDVGDLDPRVVRRFADGTRSFVERTPAGLSSLLCLGRSMSGEYDLVMLQHLLDALIVQRHPTGQVRTYGRAGVTRWDGIGWYHEPPVTDIRDRVAAGTSSRIDRRDLHTLLLFAVHELSPRRIGATLLWRPKGALPLGARWEPKHARVPPVGLAEPGGAASIASALAQTDGAAVFHEGCRLSLLGVQLVPSEVAKREIELMGGTRHTSALRYSLDDPEALLIVVSEDGPVTVMDDGRTIVVDADTPLIG